MKTAEIRAKFQFFATRLIGQLPLSVLRALGKTLGTVLFHLNIREVRVARSNLALIYPSDSSQVTEQKTRALIQSTAQTLFETLAVWTRNQASVLKLIQNTHGETYLQDALTQNNGVILAVPHYGNWELVIKAMANRGPFSLVYRLAKTESAEHFLHYARTGENIQLVPAETHAMRPLLRALNAGEVIGITPDHQPKLGGGEFAPFYGIPALTLSLLVKLSKRSGAPIVFAFCERVANGFELHFQEPLKQFPTQGLQDALQEMNRRVAAIAERDFRQYQWTYKRFSIQPNTMAENPYK